jgi:hypothetical protein
MQLRQEGKGACKVKEGEGQRWVTTGVDEGK